MDEGSARELVVEDDRSIRVALEESLREEGYQVRVEADGCRLDEVANRFRPDIAILDVRLPRGPHGFDLARQLRASSDVPLLFLTAADSVQDRLAGFQVGGDDYLVKPFSMAELLPAFRRCCGVRAGWRRARGRWGISCSTTGRGWRSELVRSSR